MWSPSVFHPGLNLQTGPLRIESGIPSPKLKRIPWLSYLPIHKFWLLRAFLRRRTGMQLKMSISNWYNCLQLHHNCWNMILILNKFLVEPGCQYLPEARGRISMTGFMVSRSKMINLVGLWLFSGGPHRPARTGLLIIHLIFIKYKNTYIHSHTHTYCRQDLVRRWVLGRCRLSQWAQKPRSFHNLTPWFFALRGYDCREF